MSKREIPRGLRDVADLLKHPAISLEVKQQLLAQLSPEDLTAIGYKPPKPAPIVPAAQPVALDEPRQVSTPPPLKLVTSWPVEILGLDPDHCEGEELEEEEVTAVRTVRIQPECTMAPTSWGSTIIVEVLLLWPWAVTAAAVLLVLTTAIHLLSVSS
jgi:hypothetical protein